MERDELLFPDTKILVNTPAVLQTDAPPEMKYSSGIEQAADFLEEIIRAKPEWRDQLVLGTDYYYEAANGIPIPFTSARVDTKMGIQALRGKSILDDLRLRLKSLGIGQEITELQMEPWSSNPKPGNSITDLRYAILRSLPILDTSEQSVIRVWGIEDLVKRKLNEELTEAESANITKGQAGTLTPEQMRMCDLFSRLNKKTTSGQPATV